MKKIYTSIFCLCAAMGVNAQSEFVLSPVELNGAELSLYGESLSENQVYVAGQDQNTSNPVIWNTVTGEVVMLQDEEMLYDYESDTPYIEAMTGTFHYVNDNGLAVGEFGAPSAGSHAIVCDINNPEDYDILYEEEGDAGSAAYAISEDGSTIVGFHFDSAWTTYGCVWTDGGKTRTELPWPTAAECGFDIDYASARGMSADGSVIMGYVQDYNYGSWVFVCWERQADGTYAVNASAADKYFEYDYQLGKPYMEFEPTGISRNGEWVTLVVEEEYDPWDWGHTPAQRAARLNLKSNELEVLDGQGTVFGIANNGTAVGRVMDANWSTAGIVWYAGEQEVKFVAELLDEEALAGSIDSSVSSITGDAKAVTGVCMTEDFLQYAYVAQIPGGQTTGVKGIENVAADGVAYDMMGRRVLNTNGHITIINGKKVLK